MLIKAFDKLSSFRHTGNGQYDKCIDPSGAETGIFLHNKIKTMCHYSDATMKVMASQITGIRSVCSAVSSSAHQRKHQSTVSLAFVRETTADRWIPHKGPVTPRNISIWWRWDEGDVIMMCWWAGNAILWLNKINGLTWMRTGGGGGGGGGGRFKNIYELLNPRALKISMLY